MNEDFAMLDLFERTLDLVCIVDKAGWFKKVNPAVIKTLGYSEEELFAKPVSVFIHPEDKEITASKRNHLLNNIPLLNFQNRYIAKNGNVVWLEWTSVYIAEKELVFAIAKDITQRKQIEIEIEHNYKKYKTLTTHFKDHVEKDRQFFATELHEELAQIATVLKMDFEWIFLQRHLLDELTRKRVDHGLLSTQLLIDKIRKLSYSINPASIKELGLNDALQSLCEEFSSRAGLSCSYTSSFNEQALDYEVKLDLLRICQEALLNVMHHAQATAVEIKLTERINRIELLIIDNGKGFNHESRQSFGLRNIEGRTASINGKLSIKSAKSKGTRISVSVEAKK
jgi:PAS domain S-box-containing protein